MEQTYHKALEEVLAQVKRAGGENAQITLSCRYEPKGGRHVHATARVTLRFHAVAHEKDAEQVFGSARKL